MHDLGDFFDDGFLFLHACFCFLGNVPSIGSGGRGAGVDSLEPVQGGLGQVADVRGAPGNLVGPGGTAPHCKQQGGGHW